MGNLSIILLPGDMWARVRAGLQMASGQEAYSVPSIVPGTQQTPTNEPMRVHTLTGEGVEPEREMVALTEAR